MSDSKKLYRNIQRIVRLAPEENELVKKRMESFGFTNFNTYACYMLMTGQVITVDYSELTKLRTEINRIGVNINQLARYANTNDKINLSDFLELQSSVLKISQLVDDTFKNEASLLQDIHQQLKEGDYGSNQGQADQILQQFEEGS
ncbi:plasmid mobilization protein [Streptococcus sp. zg-JUN1979]|uniref:plasmid mobilization protein n=1 Tax=Streptococcus sp. zg-JUN1979 TaxID=3391450 RepID=UPI0039A6707E